jgi:hypothetical protein
MGEVTQPGTGQAQRGPLNHSELGRLTLRLTGRRHCHAHDSSRHLACVRSGRGGAALWRLGAPD